MPSASESRRRITAARMGHIVKPDREQNSMRVSLRIPVTFSLTEDHVRLLRELAVTNGSTASVELGRIIGRARGKL